MRKLILPILFLIHFFMKWVHSKDENIMMLGIYNLTDNTFSDSTLVQNKTYQLHPQLFNRSYNSFYIEMEVNVTRSQQDDIQLLFAICQTYSLQLNSKTQHFEADFIDKRGFYMKKKYFRLDFEKSYLIDQNPLYLTIYQTTLDVKELNYTVKFGVQDNGETKACPFDCFSSTNQGLCNSNTGQCACQKGFFDLDCSRQSLNLDFYREQSLSSPYYFTWKTTFSKTFKSAFYHQISNQLSGYLYMQIKKRDNVFQSQKENNENGLEDADGGNLYLFYASESQNSSTQQMADSFFAKQSFKLSDKQLMSGEEIFLESFIQNERILINDNNSNEYDNNDRQIDLHKLNNTHNNQNSIQLFFGFRQDWQSMKDDDLIEYEIILTIKQHGPQQITSMGLLSSSTTVITMSIILVLLIVILVVLVLYLHKRTQLINLAISTINKRKSKKELEYNSILELIPVFKFTEELKKQLSVGQEEDPACPVCLCEFEIDEDIRKTYCPHHFHADCLQEWLRKQKNCPHCRNVQTPRTIKQRLDNPLMVQSDQQIEGFQMIKSPKKNKDYVQQIDDDISINISKISKKSKSPDKASQKTISPEKSPKKSKSPDKSPKKSQSPPKSPWRSKQPDLSEIITTVRPHNQILKKKRTLSSLSSSKYAGSPKGLTLQKLQSLENIADESFKHKSETLIPNFKELVNSEYQGGITIATEVITQTGDRTNTNLKNRGSILSSGVVSLVDSTHKINKLHKKHGRSAISQIIKKSDSLFENES